MLAGARKFDGEEVGVGWDRNGVWLFKRELGGFVNGFVKDENDVDVLCVWFV